mmetsp:Transcript_43456/g.86258  ORF Transcript_43456/g.86258 Transcript_43456/m.86258 type:complete len:94 (+) Transcript_43456:142-423(+)
MQGPKDYMALEQVTEKLNICSTKGNSFRAASKVPCLCISSLGQRRPAVWLSFRQGNLQHSVAQRPCGFIRLSWLAQFSVKDNISFDNDFQVLP